MIPVMANTNMDKSMIDFAGVDSGAKIFVRPVDDAVGLAAAAVAANPSSNANINEQLVGKPFPWGRGLRPRAFPAGWELSSFEEKRAVIDRAPRRFATA